MGFLKKPHNAGRYSASCFLYSSALRSLPCSTKVYRRKTNIVRVVKDVKSGAQITKDMVQTVEVGGYNLPEDVIRQSETVVGKYASADLFSGDYILPEKISDVPAAENGLSLQLKR